MAAGDLLQFLSTTVKSELLSRVLASSRDVEGMASPVFRLVGPPNAITFAGGEVKAQHVDDEQLLAGTADRPPGAIHFGRGETQFDQVTGHLGDLLVQVQGGITGGTGSVFRDLAVRISGDAAHMANLVPAKAIPPGTMEGMASTLMVITGASGAPHLRGELALTDSKVSLPGIMEKPTGAPVTVTFEGDVEQSKHMTLTRVEIAAPPIRLPIKGKIQLGDKFFIDALPTGTLSCRRCQNGLSKEGSKPEIWNCPWISKAVSETGIPGKRQGGWR